MSDKRKLIELDIDVEGIIAKSAYLKSELDKLKASQNELKKSGDTSSEAYVKLAAQISKVSSEYNINQKQLTNLAQVNDKYLNINQKVNLALDKEIASIEAAIDNNKELIKVRNSLNLSKESEKKLADEINAKIDANNKFMKENVSEREKEIYSIGGYKAAITAAIQETGLFNGQLSGLKSVYETSLKVMSPFKNDIYATADGLKSAAAETQGMSVAQKALTIATNLGTGAMRIFTLAIAATGIGLIIIAIALLINYFKSFTPIVDVVEQALSGFGAVIKVIQQGITSFITGLSDLGGTLKKIGSFLSDPIKGFKEMGKAMSEAYDEAAKLKKAQQDLEDAMDSQEIQTAKNRAEINRLNIQAKDRTKSEQERLALLAKAAKLEEEDFKQRKANNDEQMELALQQIKNEAKLTDIEFEELKKRGFAYKEYVEKKTNNTDELFDNLKKAVLANTDIENEFYSNQEKNINKKNALIEKAEENAKKIEEAQSKRREEAAKLVDKAISKLKTELDIFIASQGIRAKSLEDEIALAEKIKDKKLAIAKKEFEAKKITDKEYQLQSLNIKNEFLQKQADITVAFADQELKTFLDNNKSKLKANKFLTDELVAQELDRLNRIAEAEAAAQTTRLVEGTINQQQYNDAIKAIDDKYNADKKAVEEEKAQADLDKKAIDLENKRAYEDIVFKDNFDIASKRLEEERLQQISNTDKTGASIDLINKKYAAAQIDLENKVRIAKISNTQNAIGAIGELTRGFFGENRLLAGALAGIDAILGAQKAYLSQLIPGDPTSFPRAILAGAQAGAFGALNVVKISGVKLAKGAIDLDGPGTTTSDSIPAMLSKGESVITAEATSNNKELLKAINANAGMDFSKQFLPSSVVNMYSNNSSSTGIDYDLMAAKVAQANLSLPKPVVYAAITDINTGQDDYAKILNGANLS